MANERHQLKTGLIIMFLLLNIRVAYTQTNYMPPIPQQTNVWCWAACMEMIIKYHNPSANITQCSLARNHYNLRLGKKIDLNLSQPGCMCSCPNTNTLDNCATYKKIKAFDSNRYFEKILKRYGYKSKEDITRMSWDDVKRQIDSCHPFIAVVRFVNQDVNKHAVVVKGYEETGEDKFVWVNDPLRSCNGGTSEFCDNTDSSCQFAACGGCVYRLNFAIFNEMITFDIAPEQHITGFVRTISPIIAPPNPLPCRVIGGIVSHLNGTISQMKVIQMDTSQTINDNTFALSAQLIDTGATITMRYIASNKLLNQRDTSNNVESYLSNLITREVLIKSPQPQSISEEFVNGRWRKSLIRNLKDIPRYTIRLQNSGDSTKVILKNQNGLDARNVVDFEYIEYSPLLYSFFRFKYNGIYYLSPTANLTNPINGRVFANSGIAYPEKTMIANLKTVAKAFDDRTKNENSNAYIR